MTQETSTLPAVGSALPALNAELIEWIAAQHVFVVASAPSEGGHVNLSPKGHDTLRVLDPVTVAYLDLTGSGAETIAHPRDNGRAHDHVVRLCGAAPHPAAVRHRPGPPRRLAAQRIQTSCGYSVPFMDHRKERPTLEQWAARMDRDELAAYWAKKNTRSIDGLPALEPDPRP